MDIPGSELLREMLSSADARGRRSTALTDLRWALAALLVAFIVAAGVGTVPWVVTFLAICTAATLIALLVSHFLFVRDDPDLLRSESFTLRKMEIERGLLGDSRVGLAPAEKEVRALPGSMPSAEGEKGVLR